MLGEKDDELRRTTVYALGSILEGEGSVVVHWVVQRDTQTGALITFQSFADYSDALRHQAKLEAIVDSLGRTN